MPGNAILYTSTYLRYNGYSITWSSGRSAKEQKGNPTAVKRNNKKTKKSNKGSKDNKRYNGAGRVQVKDLLLLDENQMEREFSAKNEQYEVCLLNNRK